jgi:polysaccharide export outer membrane protein
MHKRIRLAVLFGTSIAAFSVALGCHSGGGKFVWVDDMPNSALGNTGDAAYVIATGDVISVRVYNQDGISTRGKVRADGKISVPLVGEVEARGKKPAELAKLLEVRLKEFIVAPAVTVTVEEAQATQVSVLGEVVRPAIVTLDAHAGVLEALAAGGGLTDFANRDRIYVYRRGTPAVRIRFTWETLSRGEGKGAAFVLKQGDVVVVE